MLGKLQSNRRHCSRSSSIQRVRRGCLSGIARLVQAQREAVREIATLSKLSDESGGIPRSMGPTEVVDHMAAHLFYLNRWFYFYIVPRRPSEAACIFARNGSRTGPTTVPMPRSQMQHIALFRYLFDALPPTTSLRCLR